MSSSASIPVGDLTAMHPGVVSAIDWHKFAANEARRLREFGLDEGVEVELLQPSGWLGGPMSLRIGRMTVALRKHVGDAIHVVQAA
ncbi:FeoA family protein [Sphingomonas soli]|uniref:FeoA family protein n=1 Tax=Sphingomonas soli TaxID=266127 RepID=UPI000A037701|nr:FeoA family protein [Sphingomonas soli]